MYIKDIKSDALMDEAGVWMETKISTTEAATTEDIGNGQWTLNTDDYNNIKTYFFHEDIEVDESGPFFQVKKMEY